MVDEVFVNGRDALVGRGLVQLVAVCAAVKAVQTQEGGRFREGAAGVALQKTLEIGFRRVIVLCAVVAQAPVILDRVVPGGAVGYDGEGLEQLGGLGVLALAEVVECGFVFGVSVAAFQQDFVLALACCKQSERHGGGRDYSGCVFHRFKNFSASRAARQPEAAAVMAWR